MKKTKKENPITFFRKADEARQKVVKASLKKAQDGISMGPTKGTDVGPSIKKAGVKVYSGPLTERDTKTLDDAYPSTTGKNPKMKGEGSYSPKAVESTKRSLDENYLRSGDSTVQKWNANQSYPGENYPQSNSTNYKKGGAIKKKMQTGGSTSKFGIKSYNYMDTEKGGRANSSSKQVEGEKYGEGNKRKYINLDADKGTMTKTKFDKNNESSTKVKNIGTKRVANKISKITSQKTGGAIKKMAKGGATKATKFAALAPPYNKATAADRIVGAKKNAKKK
jgi:hypothetical protein